MKFYISFFLSLTLITFGQTVFGLDSSIQNLTTSNSTFNDSSSNLSPQTITQPFTQFTELVNEQISNNPLSLFILQNMEKQKFEYSHPQEITAGIDPLKDERKLVNTNLQNDLMSMEKESIYNSPHVAFSRFVNTVDQAVTPIFWGQFNFTSDLHEQGLKAKSESLQNGGTSLDATKAFQRGASSHKHEIIKLNQDLNIKYTNSSKTTQNQFDENGKLPRSDD